MARAHGGIAPLILRPLADAGVQLDCLLARASCAVLTDDDAPVMLAFSGGADSSALLALAVRAGRPVHAVHVDHGLRPDSATDAARATSAAMMLGATSARSMRVSIEPGGNVEERARDARHEALEHARDERGAQFVLFGHTLDDQAETVLLAVLRGSGITGLSAMAARRGAMVRPLLDVRRSETRELCSVLGVDVIDDPMNHDRRIERVWLREELLPTLSARTGRDLGPVLARQAARIAEESEYLDRAAAEALRAAGDTPAARALAGLDRVILRRALRRLVGPPWIGGGAVDAAVEVVMGARKAVELPRGRTLVRRDGNLAVERASDPSGTVRT